MGRLSMLNSCDDGAPDPHIAPISDAANARNVCD